MHGDSTRSECAPLPFVRSLACAPPSSVRYPQAPGGRCNGKRSPNLICSPPSSSLRCLLVTVRGQPLSLLVLRFLELRWLGTATRWVLLLLLSDCGMAGLGVWGWVPPWSGAAWPQGAVDAFASATDCLPPRHIVPTAFPASVKEPSIYLNARNRIGFSQIYLPTYAFAVDWNVLASALGYRTYEQEATALWWETHTKNLVWNYLFLLITQSSHFSMNSLMTLISPEVLMLLFLCRKRCFFLPSHICDALNTSQDL